jgi:hypothetical protein
MSITSSKQQVLADYQANQKTTNEIAQAHHISLATITGWAKKAGLPLRRRGRWRMKEPTPRHITMIELAKTFSYRALGSRFGVSGQSVWRMVNRWRPSVTAGKPTNQSVPPAVSREPEPVLCPLTDDDLTGDIERIIRKTVTPYVDPSNPMLQLDELQAECRAKLAKIIHGGRLAHCPTRGKVFAFVKTSFRNHVRSLVQKYAFTAKRTGVEPPRRLPLGAGCAAAAKKVQVIRLDDPDIGHQVGRDDERFRQGQIMEELFAQLSPTECAELSALIREVPDRSPENGDGCDLRRRQARAEREARLKLLRKCRAILMT